MLPDAPPEQLLTTFLTAHSQVGAVPAVLFARGEELYRRLAGDPPPVPAWGRFLVALGELAAERMDDAPAASRYFLAALQGVARHGDHEAAVTAGYNQGVLQERRNQLTHARAAYRAAAGEGFRLGAVSANTLRSASAAVRLFFAAYGEPGEAAPLAKQAWLGWLWLRRNDPRQLADEALVGELGRQLCALLLPEDDPGALAADWRAWAPHHLRLADGGQWADTQPDCLDELFAAAAESADRHLADEGHRPGDPYRLLRDAARRMHGWEKR